MELGLMHVLLEEHFHILNCYAYDFQFHLACFNCAGQDEVSKSGACSKVESHFILYVCSVDFASLYFLLVYTIVTVC